MVEVTLIAPATQVQNVGAGGQQTQNATQTGLLATPHLSPGALVSGIITGKDTGGNYMLKTEQGTFTLHSNTPLTYNSDVLIRVDTSSGSNAAARIITVNGEAFSSYSAPVQPETDSLSPNLLAKAEEQPAQSAAANTDPTTRATANTVAVRAVTVPPPSAAPAQSGASNPAPAPAQSSVPNGIQVTLHVPVPEVEPASPPVTQPATTSGTSPAVSTAPAPAQNTSTSTGSPPAPAQSAAPAPGALPVTSPAATSLPTNVAKLVVAQPQALNDPVTVTSSLLASAQTPAEPPASPTLQTSQYAAYAKTSLPAAAPVLPNIQVAVGQALVSAQVAEQHPDGNYTLSLPQGQVTVKPEALPATVGTLPQASNLTVSLPAVFANTQPQATAGDSVWTPLKQILTLVQDRAPATATELFSRMPSIGEHFLSGSIFFLNFLMQGNIKKFLGENVLNILKDAGADDLVETFAARAHATAQSFSQSQEPSAPQSWQNVTLPFVYQGALQEARIYVKRDAPRKDKDQKKTAADTRFVVEVDFSDLGAMQLDGLVLPREKHTVFDLVVRTHSPFTPEERMDITGIYANAAELTGFKGNITFHAGKQFPVNPLAEMAAQPVRDIIA